MMKTKMTMSARPLFLFALGVLFTHNASAFDLNGVMTKDLEAELVPEQREMLSVQPEPRYQPPLTQGEEPLKVSAWVNRKNNIPTYHLGETVTFFVKTNKDAYITLFDIGTTGKMHVIFPNKFQRTNFIPANKVFSIPQSASQFQFKVKGKTGTEMVKVIATSTRETLVDEKYLKDTGVFKAVTKDIDAVAVDINNQFNQPENKTEWAVYSKALYIR